MRIIKCALAISIAALTLSATARAATVTVGSPLTGTFTTAPTSKEGTAINFALAAPGAHATSPVTGVVLRWHLLGAEGGPFRLRVLHPAGGLSFTGAGSSAAVVATTTGLETFPTALPIQAGDAIGLDLVPSMKLAFQMVPGSGAASWIPPLADGTTRPYEAPTSGAEFGFNAEIQAQPTVTQVAPASGSFQGGSAVSIAGTGFAGVSAVKFGPNAAVSYAIGSEGQITAVAPPGTIGPVDITVTTVAGTSPATAVDQFTYQACVVPKLKDKKLKAAKRKLRKADCKVGKVKRKKGVTAKSGEVVKQSRDPGGKLAPGTKVNITLG